ncbi:GNAT family N-acetyltransferase [Alicyclobacillus sp. SO9]|uniref:GNAT family N-acetyltransferase n=1 Tax=Alicyclobacillus sp. SO9 TaxID=2665646 RepID=UPI0018E74123|nr:GNAT family N-acetyltransferase [Alicyclobacillus sp. SO9]QQE79978.1 GNAT family N-acetyltransferase [Alicyclobacillus sp. SO9]
MTVSFLVAAVAFAAAFLFHQSLTPIPLWDKVAMSYGGVFCVFWFFDTAGKKVSKKFAGDDEEPPRPAPRPPSDTRQRVVLPGESRYSNEGSSYESFSLTQTPEVSLQPDREPWIGDNSGQGRNASPSLSLERVRTHQKLQWQEMLDVFAGEILALDGVMPETDEEGHAKDWRAEKLLTAEGVYSFWIELDNEKIGTIVGRIVQKNTADTANDIENDADSSANAKTHADTASKKADVKTDDAVAKSDVKADAVVEIRVVFVHTAWRRRGIARASLEKLTEFLLLLEESCKLHCEISDNNYRARRYLEACGFRAEAENAVNNQLKERRQRDLEHTKLDDEKSLTTNSRQIWIRVIS